MLPIPESLLSELDGEPPNRCWNQWT